MKPLIIAAALLLCLPSYLADAGLAEWERYPYPAVVMEANGNKYMMWGPDKVLLYPGGIKRREHEK